MAAPDITALLTEPNSNPMLGTINVAENCPAANVNDALRYIAACVAVLRGTVPATATFMPKTGDAFTGNPTFSGQGGYLHNAASTATGGSVSVLPAGSAFPAGVDGDIVIFYA